MFYDISRDIAPTNALRQSVRTTLHLDKATKGISTTPITVSKRVETVSKSVRVISKRLRAMSKDFTAMSKSTTAMNTTLMP